MSKFLHTFGTKVVALSLLFIVSDILYETFQAIFASPGFLSIAFGGLLLGTLLLIASTAFD